MTQLSDRDLLARLIAFDSTSRNSNVPIADAICDYLDRPDVRITRYADESGEKVNVVACRGPQNDRSGLLLCGHLDVVPADEPGWSSDPFRMEERDGAYFGRGTCDMKGSVAIAANLLLEADPARLTSPVCVLFTRDEELGSLGAQAYLAARSDADPPLPAATVIGEPTSLRVVRLHKGHLKLRLAFAGKAAHSGSPHLGRNAIEPAGRAIVALSTLKEAMAAERPPSHVHFPQVPFAVLNVGRVRGGETVNVIPDSCVIDIGVRLLPGQSTDDIIPRVREAAGGDAEVQVINDNPPMELGEDAAVHRELQRLAGQDGSCGVSFASDAGWLRRIGHECVLFGPGSIEDAHRPDEYVPIDELTRCHEVLAELVQRFCYR